MVKKIKNNLSAKVFLRIAGLLILCSLFIYGIVMIFLPQSYTVVSSNRVEAEMKELTEMLPQTNFDQAKDAIDQFCQNNHAAVVLSGTDTELRFGSVGHLDNQKGEIITSAQEIQFADTNESYLISITASVSAGSELTMAFGELFPLLLVLIVVISALGAFLCSRILVRPVLEISRVSKRMANLDMTWECSVNRTDELGVLANSLNNMAKRLDATLKELEHANQKLREDMEHITELSRQRRDFFAAASHELKTPITIIKGQTEGMILNVGDYQNRSKYLSRSLEIINTMESMVQEILTVSRMKSSKVGLRKEKMDFSDLLKREYALFEDLIVQKEIDWNENISPALQIAADKMLIQKAINNIVSNAILYSPRGSSIYMDAFSKNGSVVFQIENTGVHIPEAEISKLFDAFYRMEQSRNRKTGGSGLGLYIVKTILEQHNIIYSLKNTDRGVLFSIRF
mgnify:CR=1 FL=1